MSAPPLYRLADERRISVVRDAAMVRRVLDEDPVGSCMVASRVADHGVDPTAIGGELWRPRLPSESLCYAGPTLIPLRGDVDDLTAFADKAMSSARRCSSLVGRAELVLPMWRACAARILDSAQPVESVGVLDAAAVGYRDLVADPQFETSGPKQARLFALQRLFIDRPPGLEPHPRFMGPVVDDARKGFLSARFGPARTRFAAELLGVLELERGFYGGRPVDVAVIDGIFARNDATLLRRFGDRLPSPALREEARRRVIRLAIAASAYSEVRAQAADVEARVLRDGTNRISLVEHPPGRASIDPRALPSARGARLLIRQDIPRGRATVLGRSTDGRPTAPSEVSLRRTLWIDVDGVSRAVTLCAPRRALDPSPCVGDEDVHVTGAGGGAMVDRGGVLRFLDVDARGLQELGRAEHALTLTFAVGQQALASMTWPLRFERPGPLVLAAPSGKGPALDVHIARPATPSAPIEVTVRSGATEYHAFVEREDLPAFHVVSRGGPGRAGPAGSDGAEGVGGFVGAMASCPSSTGSDGGSGGGGRRGGDGQDGEPGADGGPITVEIACVGEPCSAAELAMLGRVPVSEGGPGGSGGPGGRGGRGGAGGPGGVGVGCDVDGNTRWLPPGHDGMRGSDGSDGHAGHDGPFGRADRVEVSVVPAPRDTPVVDAPVVHRQP